MQKNYKDHYIFDSNGVLVFVPESKYNVDAIDPIIEKKELQVGYVKSSELVRVIKLDENHFEPYEEQKETLSTIHALLDNQGEIQTMVIEYELSTIIEKHINTLYFRKLLPVKHIKESEHIEK